jgi:L-lysine 6-transaminase
MGKRFLDGLEQLASRHPAMSNVRGRGLSCAFTLPSADERDRLRARPWERGLATLASWPRSLRFRPCLNVTADEVDAALERLDDGLAALATARRAVFATEFTTAARSPVQTDPAAAQPAG